MFCDRVIVCFAAQPHLKFILKNYSIWNSQNIVGKYQASMEDFRFLLVFIISCSVFFYRLWFTVIFTLREKCAELKGNCNSNS